MELFYKNSARVSEEQIKETAAKLEPYREYLNQILSHDQYDAHECSVNLPIDQNLISMVREVKKNKAGKKLKYVVVIGIGGSSLGAKAVYDALCGAFDAIEPARFPKLMFLETNDPQYLEKFCAFLKTVKTPDEILLNVISKSGTTTETVVNLEIAGAAVREQFGDEALHDRLVVTTDENSKLWNLAKAKKITLLPIPEAVGGRYSVFSPVGLFPLSAAGIDTEALCEGAAVMRKNCIENELDQNPALISATLLYLNAKSGKTINDNFFFAPQLESLGKWYRQLMGESIGKEQDREGNVVHAGITPTVSIGSTDLHSVGQLYLGGPLDKMTTFVWVRNVPGPMGLPDEPFTDNLVENLKGKSAQNIMSAILEGTKAAYGHKEMPFMENVLPEITPFALGEYLQYKMVEMMYLGRLFEVNPFDQPHVELYKKETRKILKGA